MLQNLHGGQHGFDSVVAGIAFTDGGQHLSVLGNQVHPGSFRHHGLIFFIEQLPVAKGQDILVAKKTKRPAQLFRIVGQSLCDRPELGASAQQSLWQLSRPELG